MILVHVLAVHDTIGNIGCTQCSEPKAEGVALDLLLGNKALNPKP